MGVCMTDSNKVADYATTLAKLSITNTIVVMSVLLKINMI